MTMEKLDASNIEQLLKDATFADIDSFNYFINIRLTQLTYPEHVFAQMCNKKQWIVNWYKHPGLPLSVFLCVRYGHDNKKYREFMGYHQDLRMARYYAIQKALQYFNTLSQTKNTLRYLHKHTKHMHKQIQQLYMLQHGNAVCSGNGNDSENGDNDNYTSYVGGDNDIIKINIDNLRHDDGDKLHVV